jgi:Holliday junction resolvase
MMMAEGNITKKGEIEVVNQLRGRGWNVQSWDPSAEGSRDIVATSGGKKIFVQVQTAEAPDNPQNLTKPEMETMAARARRENAECYQARVKLDQDLNRVGDIGWMKIC